MKTSVVVLLGLLLGQRAVSAPPAKAETKDPLTLAKARAAAAQKVYEAGWLLRESEPARAPGFDFFYVWSRRWAKAEREACKDIAGQVAALERHWERMKKLEQMTKKLAQRGFAARYEVPIAEFYRLEAEGWLAKAKAK